MIKKIALTLGEPAGIGADLCIKLAQQSQACQLIVIADPELLIARAEQLALPISIKTYRPDSKVTAQQAGEITVLPIKMAVKPSCGQLKVANATYVLATISRATQACISGEFSAMVTAPVHKGIINRAGFSFSGHTEYIANLCGGHPVMMLATEGLRVALVTTHLPLSAVSEAITPECLTKVLKVLNKDLKKRFGLTKPRILVCGLNPHAGENGYLGNEEIEVINPVLAKCRKQGLNVSDALPADTIFTPKYLENADAVLAMYHDQGLPVLKHKGFGKSVNITLGLPIIRTSVDHGTALDLAGTGNINTNSLQYAIDTALTMTGN